MYSNLFEQSFINDSLKINDGLERKEQIISNGVRVVLHDAGIFEVIPLEITEETDRLLVTSCSTLADVSYLGLIDTLLNDILSGFQHIKTHCLFVFNEVPDSKNNERALDESLKNHIEEFLEGVNPKNALHLDVSLNSRPSHYSTVAFSPKVRKLARSRRLFEFLALSHIDAVVLNNAPTNTLSWNVANQFEVDSVQIQLSTRSLASNERKNQGFELALRDLLANEKSEHIAKSPKYFRVTRTIVKQHDDFHFLFSANIPNFTRFKHGEVFGMDGDKPLMAKNDGEAILFPDSDVSVGEVAAVMVFDVFPRYEEDQLIYD